MEVTYKYVLESKPKTKSYNTFINSFFKDHFDEFMNGEIMIMISPDLGNNLTLLQLDLDYKLNESNKPDDETMRVFNNLISAFGKNSFNLEITPGGAHIVSRFIYTRLHSLTETKKELSSYFKLVKNMDIDASFNSIPLKRIGYDPNRGFWYTPINPVSQTIRNQLFSKKPMFTSRSFWEDYIKHYLINDSKTYSFIQFLKHLDKFSKLMRVR